MTERTAAGPESRRFDAICVGETMAMVTPTPAVGWTRSRPSYSGRWRRVQRRDVPRRARAPGGLGRPGRRRPPRRARRRADRRGRCDTSLVEVDPTRPTAVYLKDPTPDGTRVYYYRRGSAAAGMDETFAARVAEVPAAVLHLSGITPALSAGCRRLVDELVLVRPAGGRLGLVRRQLPSRPLALRRRRGRRPAPTGPPGRRGLRRARRGGTAVAGPYARAAAGAHRSDRHAGGEERCRGRRHVPRRRRHRRAGPPGGGGGTGRRRRRLRRRLALRGTARPRPRRPAPASDTSPPARRWAPSPTSPAHPRSRRSRGAGHPARGLAPSGHGAGALLKAGDPCRRPCSAR